LKLCVIALTTKPTEITKLALRKECASREIISKDETARRPPWRTPPSLPDGLAEGAHNLGASLAISVGLVVKEIAPPERTRRIGQKSRHHRIMFGCSSNASGKEARLLSLVCKAMLAGKGAPAPTSCAKALLLAERSPDSCHACAIQAGRVLGGRGRGRQVCRQGRDVLNSGKILEGLPLSHRT
jgi:hypothetical protein